MSCRIVLADNHQIMRECLKALFAREPDMQVVGEAGNGRKALGLVRELIPDVVVMDVKMPDFNGIEAVRRIHSELPQVKVIALSVHADRRSLKNMLKAGACVCLLKDCAFEELAQAIRLVMSNRIYLSPGLADLIVKDYASHDSAGITGSVFSVLGSREREVLQLLSEGSRTAHIAEVLQISIKTVETHRARMMETLGLRRGTDLVRFAIENRLEIERV